MFDQTFSCWGSIAIIVLFFYVEDIVIVLVGVPTRIGLLSLR